MREAPLSRARICSLLTSEYVPRITGNGSMLRGEECRYVFADHGFLMLLSDSLTLRGLQNIQKKIIFFEKINYAT